MPQTRYESRTNLKSLTGVPEVTQAEWKGQPASLCPIPKTCPTSWLYTRQILDFCLNAHLQHLLLSTAGMKGTFHAASRRQRSKSSPIVIGVTVRVKTSRLTGATRSLSITRRMKGQNARQPSPWQTRAYQPERSSKLQSPETNESNPRYARIGPPVCGDQTPEGQGHRTRHPG